MGALGLTRIGGPNWYRQLEVPGVRPDLPGIYEWRVEGVGCYIGQYTNARRPLREFGRNSTRKLAGQPYRLGNPDGFRRTHTALADAVAAGRSVTLMLLENVIDKGERNARERALIAERRSAADRGGLPVLNAS